MANGCSRACVDIRWGIYLFGWAAGTAGFCAAFAYTYLHPDSHRYIHTYPDKHSHTDANTDAYPQPNGHGNISADHCASLTIAAAAHANPDVYSH